MADVFMEWGGAERRFALSFGGLLDLEEACGKIGIGEIYLRLGQHRYFARDVYHTIRLGLIGGGMPPSEADRLMKDRFDATPLVKGVEMALEILIAVMAGVEPDRTKAAGDPSQPHDVGEVLASFIKAGLSPDQVRAMRYDDLVRMSRALGGNTVQPPTEQEFADMVARLESKKKG